MTTAKDTVAAVAAADTWDKRVTEIRLIPERHGKAEHGAIFAAVARELYVPYLAPDFAFIHDAPFYDADHFDATLTVNLRAPALLAAAVGRRMVEQGTGGSIVTVASAAALAPLPEHYAYCASKAGLVMATKVRPANSDPMASAPIRSARPSS